MGEGDGVGGFEVGDGAADAADFVVGARGEAQLGHGLSEHGEGGVVERREVVEHLAAQARVGEVALSCVLAFACAHGQVAHLLGGGAGGPAGEFAPVDGGRLDVDVDAVEEGAREFGEVAFHLSFADLSGGHVAPGCGVHGGDEHEGSGEADGGVGACDGDDVIFERLAECFEDGPWELGEFVEEEDAVVRE